MNRFKLVITRPILMFCSNRHKQNEIVFSQNTYSMEEWSSWSRTVEAKTDGHCDKRVDEAEKVPTSNDRSAFEVS